MRLASFVLAVVIGFGVGYFLDRWLGLTPLLTIVFFFVGVAAGVVNVVRAAASFGRGSGDDDGRP
jgi:ATP synthase protein I